MRGRRLAAAAIAVLAFWNVPRDSAGASAPREGGGALASFRLIDATAASINGEIVFLSDVAREACFERCGAFPGEAPDNASLSDARKKLIYNRLILQEQRKLALGAVDNDTLAIPVSAVKARMAGCPEPCAGTIGDADIHAFVSDRFLVTGFLDKRVSVFIEVQDEEVQRVIGRRASSEGKDPDSYSEDQVRAELRREKSSLEIRNWYYKAASNARIFLSPLEDK